MRRRSLIGARAPEAPVSVLPRDMVLVGLAGVLFDPVHKTPFALVQVELLQIFVGQDLEHFRGDSDMFAQLVRSQDATLLVNQASALLGALSLLNAQGRNFERIRTEPLRIVSFLSCTFTVDEIRPVDVLESLLFQSRVTRDW